MLPIAKAGVLLVLIGAGVTATYAVTNGGFGNGAGSDDNTQKTAESTTASPKPEVNPDTSGPGEQPGALKGQSIEQAATPSPENKQHNSGDPKVGGDTPSQTHEEPAGNKDNPQVGSAQNANQEAQGPTG